MGMAFLSEYLHKVSTEEDSQRICLEEQEVTLEKHWSSIDLKADCNSFSAAIKCIVA